MGARSWILKQPIALFRLLVVPLLLLGPTTGHSAPPEVQSGQYVQTNLDDWLQGTLTNVYVEGGDLRLQPDQGAGSYESRTIQAPFGLTAAVLQWHAQSSDGQTLTLELRSSVDGQAWADWQPAIGRDSPVGGTISQVYVLPPWTSWLQYRANLQAEAGSPTLSDVTLTYLNATAGPSLAELVGRVPPAGPPALTPPPPTVAGIDWGIQPIGTEIERQRPQRIVISEVHASADDPNSAATMRALQWVALQLEQRSVLPYHYLLDGAGNVFQGAGSGSVHLADTPAGEIRIALLADMEHEGLSEAAESGVTRLMGWLCDAWSLSPSSIEVAPDAPQQLLDLLPELRTVADRAIVRDQVYFAAGDTAVGTERLSFLNRGVDEARATLSVLSPLSQDRRTVTVPAGRRVDVVLNTAVPITGPLGLEVQSDRMLDVERTEIRGREVLGGIGLQHPARAWYFGSGSTLDGDESTLALLNPQTRALSATITLVPENTMPVSRTVSIGPRSLQNVALRELLPDQHFSIAVVAADPIVAERTIININGAAHSAPGIADLSRRWLFAEGSTVHGFTTTLDLFNPWPQRVSVTLRVLSEDGTSLDRRYSIPPNDRLAVALNDFVPDLPFAMELQAERPIVAERTMAFDDGQTTAAGPGANKPATRWTFVEGSTTQPAEETLLILNPNWQAVDLDVAYLMTDGQVEHRHYTAAASSRLTIAVNSDMPDQPIVSAVITADRPIVAERTIYVDGATGRGGDTVLGIPDN